mmetsp:Transcript_33971/g.85926  ORF Transcript_33971/g.85926 Transcript_33971/m.85926 type:complete len:396 (+) Transcript_33971:62-1249(+)
MSAWSAANGAKAGKAPKSGNKEDDVDSYFKIHEVRRVVNVAVNNVAASRPADFRAALSAELRRQDILSAAKPSHNATKQDAEKARDYLQQHQAEELLSDVLSKLAASMPTNASAELADFVASAPPPKPVEKKKEAPKKEDKKEPKKEEKSPKKEAPKKEDKKQNDDDVAVDADEADDFFAAFAGGADKVVLPPKKEEKKEDKKEEAPAAPKKDEGPPAGVDAKKWKAAVKEGGKKGVELAGCADMGGLEFFTTQIEAAEGDLALIQGAMDAANKEVDPKDEEAKGGSGLVGKMLLSSGGPQLGLVCYVPKEKGDKANATEWMKAVLDACGGGEFAGGDALTAKGFIKGDGETRFPLKDKDTCQAASVNWLKGKGLFPQADEEEDDWVCEDDTIEW